MNDFYNPPPPPPGKYLMTPAMTGEIILTTLSTNIDTKRRLYFPEVYFPLLPFTEVKLIFFRNIKVR